MKPPNPPRPKPCEDDGGPAYPTQHVGSDGSPQQPDDGLSKRDAFAMAALTGLCANTVNAEIKGLGHFPTFAAAWAYRMADACLDERAKGRAS